jgi:hypothetical protein
MRKQEASRGTRRLPCGDMNLGDIVIHDGRELVLRGLDPMSVVGGRAEVEDPRTHECWRVPIAELELAPPPDAPVSARKG